MANTFTTTPLAVPALPLDRVGLWGWNALDALQY
jgi:hypothetical protein